LQWAQKKPYTISYLPLSEMKFIFWQRSLFWSRNCIALSTWRWIFGRNNFFGSNLAGLAAKKRANRGARSSRDDPVAEHQYPFAVIEIESLRATSERASCFLEKFACDAKYLIWPRGLALIKHAKDARISKFRPNTDDHQHKYIIFVPGEAISHERVAIFRSRSICSRRKEKEKEPLCLSWSDHHSSRCSAPMQKQHKRERERVKFSVLPGRFYDLRTRDPPDWVNLIYAARQKPKALAYQRCAHTHTNQSNLGRITCDGKSIQFPAPKVKFRQGTSKKPDAAFSLEPVSNLPECSHEINAAGATGVPSRLHTSLQCRRSARCLQSQLTVLEKLINYHLLLSQN
jgi:hypothetical protein